MRARMGCDPARFTCQCLKSRFNPRTRMGCDSCRTECGIPESVSIHAPAWGATTSTPVMSWMMNCFNPRTRMGCDDALCSHDHTQGVSIHAPAWGATALGGQRAVVCWRFNPRTRMGCDSPWIAMKRFKRRFNPRTRMGCDACSRYQVQFLGVSIHAPAWGATAKFVEIAQAGKFQSTHPHGVRPHWLEDSSRA